MDANATATVKYGWLWYDNDTKTALEERLSRAANRYREKFGCQPRLCFVHAGLLSQQEVTCGRIKLKEASNVLPGHFLFEVEEQALLHDAF